MNREIKFRAWNYNSINECYEMRSFESIKNNGGAYFFNPEIFIPNPHIIMQYTGLKDKNGKEIYEGDIVIPFSDLEKGNISVIIYEFNQFRIKGKNLYWSWALDIEVIGNIHENPYLIKK